jgi:hypothetical protein
LNRRSCRPSTMSQWITLHYIEMFKSSFGTRLCIFKWINETEVENFMKHWYILCATLWNIDIYYVPLYHNIYQCFIKWYIIYINVYKVALNIYQCFIKWHIIYINVS